MAATRVNIGAAGQQSLQRLAESLVVFPPTYLEPLPPHIHTLCITWGKSRVRQRDNSCLLAGLLAEPSVDIMGCRRRDGLEKRAQQVEPHIKGCPFLWPPTCKGSSVCKGAEPLSVGAFSGGGPGRRPQGKLVFLSHFLCGVQNKQCDQTLQSNGPIFAFTTS